VTHFQTILACQNALKFIYSNPGFQQFSGKELRFLERDLGKGETGEGGREKGKGLEGEGKGQGKEGKGVRGRKALPQTKITTTTLHAAMRILHSKHSL